jgi:hypothetical protein
MSDGAATAPGASGAAEAGSATAPPRTASRAAVMIEVRKGCILFRRRWRRAFPSGLRREEILPQPAQEAAGCPDGSRTFGRAPPRPGRPRSTVTCCRPSAPRRFRYLAQRPMRRPAWRRIRPPARRQRRRILSSPAPLDGTPCSGPPLPDARQPTLRAIVPAPVPPGRAPARIRRTCPRDRSCNPQLSRHHRPAGGRAHHRRRSQLP